MTAILQPGANGTSDNTILVKSILNPIPITNLHQVFEQLPSLYSMAI